MMNQIVINEIEHLVKCYWRLYITKYDIESPNLKERFVKQVDNLSVYDNYTGDQIYGGWGLITKRSSLNEEFVNEFVDYLDWKIICGNYNFNFEWIEKYPNKIDWRIISSKSDLTEEFIRKYADKIYWDSPSSYRDFSPMFLLEFADKINWFLLFTENEKLVNKICSKLFSHFYKNDFIKAAIKSIFENE